MQLNNFRKSIGLLLLLQSFYCSAATYGTWLLLSHDTSDDNMYSGSNYITGFNVVDAGITFNSASATCYFDAVFPVYGPITFNGGNLTLNRDLVLGGDVTFANAGIITGNGWQLDLPGDVASFSMPGMTINGVRMMLHSNVILNGTLTIQGTTYIEGNGHSIDCSAGSIAVASGASLGICNATLKNMSGAEIACADSTATFTSINNTWLLSGDCSFNQGNLVVVQNLLISGSYVFAFASAQPLSIQSYGTLFFDQGVTFSYAPSSGSKTLITFTNASSTLLFNHSNLSIANGGLQLTKGTVIFQGLCTVASMGISAANGITFGDASSAANDAALILQRSASVTLTSGYLNYKNLTGASCCFNGANCLLTIGDGAALYLYTNMSALDGGIAFGNSILGRASGVDLVSGWLLPLGNITYVDL